MSGLSWRRNQVGAPADEDLLRNKLKNSVYSYFCGDEITRRDLKIQCNTSPRKSEMREVVTKLFNCFKPDKLDWFPAFSKHSLSFKVDRTLVDGKLLPDYLLTKTLITDVYIWKPHVVELYKEQHVLNFNVLIGDYAGSVQAGSFTIRFQKNLLNLEKNGWNVVSVEPPLELMGGRTYSVIVENLSKVDSVDVDGFRMDPSAYRLRRISHPNREVQINFEEVCVSLKEIHRKTDYYAEILPDFSEEPCVIRGFKIGLK